MLPDGTRLCHVEQGDPGGQPVVLLHALAESWRSWETLLAHLPTDLHVHALTQRGHGDADKPADGYDLRTAAADVIGFLDAVGVDRALLAGTSSGGLVAQQVAADTPDRVRALLLVGSPRDLRGLPAPTWVEDAAALSDPVPPAFVRGSIESMRGGRPIPPDFVDRMVEDGARVPAHVWRAVTRELLRAEPPSSTGRVVAPTVALWGDRDDLLPGSEQRRLVADVPGARLVVCPGAGHLLLWEEPERVASELVDLARAVRG